MAEDTFYCQDPECKTRGTKHNVNNMVDVRYARTYIRLCKECAGRRAEKNEC